MNSATSFYLDHLIRTSDDMMQACVCRIAGGVPEYEQIGEIAETLANDFSADLRESMATLQEASERLGTSELDTCASLVFDLCEEIDWLAIGKAIVLRTIWYKNQKKE